MQRRHVLRVLAAGTAFGLAGCSGGGTGADSPSDDQPDSSSPTSETGSDDDSDRVVPTDEEPATPTDEETTVPTDEEPATPTDEETGGGDAPTLASLDVAFEDNYRFSVTVPQMGSPVTGAFDGGNFYSVVSAGDDPVTTYVIDGVTYVETADVCTQVPGSGGSGGGVDPDSLADADTIEQDLSGPGAASLVPSGTTAIEGEQVYVYELGDAGTTATYYIGVENRRLRRVETQGTVLDYTDWGSVAPITPPC